MASASPARSTSVATRAAPGANRLLALLAPGARRQLLARVDAVDLKSGQGIYEAGQTIRWLYLPETGVVSLVTRMADGAALEVATVGNEGLVGLPVFLGVNSVPVSALVQVPGRALRLPADRFRALVKKLPELTPLLHRYALALLNQVGRSAACNRAHDIHQRCSRWLLMTHDRVTGDEFHLTQQFLGQMLGVRRASVSQAASALERLRLISYSRGRIRVLNRPGLERMACECYQHIRREYERLLGARSK